MAVIYIEVYIVFILKYLFHHCVSVEHTRIIVDSACNNNCVNKVFIQHHSMADDSEGYETGT